MKKYIPLLATAVIFVASLVILWSPLRPQITSVTPDLKTNQKWQTYRNDQYGFEFQYPQNWYLLEDKDLGLFISNKSFDSVTIDVAPSVGQIFIKIFYFHSAFENGLGITEGENGVISDTKLISRDNSLGLKYEYLKADSGIQKEEIIADQILSTFRVLTDTTTWKTFTDKSSSYTFRYPSQYFWKNINGKVVFYDNQNKMMDPDSGKLIAPNVLTISKESNLDSICPDNMCKYYNPVTIGKNTFTKFSEGIGGFNYYSNGLLIYSFLTEDTDPVLNQILSSFKFLPDTLTWKSYSNPRYGFSFKYPSWYEVTNFEENLGSNMKRWNLLVTDTKTKISSQVDPNKKYNKDVFWIALLDSFSFEPDANSPKVEQNFGNNVFQAYYAEKYEMYDVFYFEHGNILVRSFMEDPRESNEYFNQILSSFKFTQ